LPRLHLFQLDYGPHGFQSLAINLGDDWPTILQYARQYSNLYLRDDGQFWSSYRQNGYIPLNYVIDTSGVVRYVAEGFSEPAVRQAIEQYLPDQIEHDVGVTRLVAPAGSVDSGAAVTPACSLYNYRDYTETYMVRMRIGAGYDQVATVSGHVPYTYRYVEFASWAAQNRGQVVATCTTELSGDDISSNNGATQTVTINVYDLAVTWIVAPRDSVDSGTAVVPMAEVRNLGTVADMARVRLTISDGYADSVNVPLQPGRSDTAVLRAWTPTQLGSFAVRCTVRGRWEMVPENNLLTGTIRVVRTSGVEELPGLTGLSLYEVSPNPGGARTTIRYSLARSAAVGLRIYSPGGELVRTLRDGSEPAGLHSVVWDGHDDAGRSVGRGVFYCRIEADGVRVARKIVRTQ
jgi:hypothetical protein